jgi:hypothetical protein
MRLAADLPLRERTENLVWASICNTVYCSIKYFPVLGCWISVFDKLPSSFEIRSKLSEQFIHLGFPGDLVTCRYPTFVFFLKQHPA